MAACLVLGHGNLAQALVDASIRITGDCEQIYTLPSSDYAARQLQAEIANLIESKNLTSGLYIFVCLKGGSYWNAAVRIAREYKNVKVISGVNLPLILSFITKRNDYSFDELEKILIKDTIRGINVF